MPVRERTENGQSHIDTKPASWAAGSAVLGSFQLDYSRSLDVYVYSKVHRSRPDRQRLGL
jgi:hypothetical protein